MRLIDADALVKQMIKDAAEIEEPIARMYVNAAINDIKRAPTVDPMKKGHWIWDEDGMGEGE